MQLTQTTTLRKIANMDKKIRVIQGGQGSSKTFSILMLIINHAAGQPDKEIIITSAELTKMRLTVIKDFVKIMKAFGIFEPERWLAGTLYKYPNGSFVKFVGLDKDDVGKGLRCDVVYFNEVNKIDIESYRQMASRAKLVFADFNPDVEFFIHTDVVPRPDCDFIITTFKDNEALDASEREEIEMYKTLAYDDKGEVRSKYWANKWRVYGLGLIGRIDGVVFENWSVAEIPSGARLECYGIDFGFANSKAACVAIYKYDGQFYLDELVYKTKLTNQQLAEEMVSAGYNGSIVYCDSAEPKSIQELNVSGYGINAVKCDSKRDIKQWAIQRLNTSEFYITPRSENLKIELSSYIYDEKTNKPKKSDKDHLIDAMLYAIGSEGRFTGQY